MGRIILLLCIVLSSLSPDFRDWTMATISVAARKEVGLEPFKDFTMSNEKPARFSSINSGFCVTLHVLVFSITYLILFVFQCPILYSWLYSLFHVWNASFPYISYSFSIKLTLFLPWGKPKQNKQNKTTQKAPPKPTKQKIPKTPLGLWFLTV